LGRKALLTLTLLRVTVANMESKLANYAEQQLIEAARRMTREQRLRAFMEHSKRMVQLQRAGKAVRDEAAVDSSPSDIPSTT
jgi:hypothetical protein